MANEQTPDAFENPHRYQPGWSNPVFVAGIAVGAVLAFCGYLGPSFLQGVSSISSTFLLISGVSIIFGAFGANASYKRKGIVVGGVASIALLAFATFHYFQQKEIGILQIRGDVRDIKAELTGVSALPGAHHGNYLEFRFLPGEVEIDLLSLSIAPGGENEVEFNCIPQSAVARAFGARNRLVWRYDSASAALSGVKDGNQPVLPGPCETVDDNAPRFTSLDLPDLITAAHAARPIAKILADLESNAAVVRRSARKELTALGRRAIQPMMTQWDRRRNIYRVRLGICVALTEYLRGHKNERKQISNLLSDQDIEKLTRAAADEDRTLRIYASEFLYDLGDPRVITASDNIFRSADDNGRYNLIVVLSGTIDDLDDNQRIELERKLKLWRLMVGQKTRTLIDRIQRRIS